MDLTSSLEAKFGPRSGQVHKIRGKILEVLSPQDAKVGKKSQFWGISEIQRAKFCAFVTSIFAGKIWGSNKNFRGKFWGQAPRPPNMKVPPGTGGLESSPSFWTRRFKRSVKNPDRVGFHERRMEILKVRILQTESPGDGQAWN